MTRATERKPTERGPAHSDADVGDNSANTFVDLTDALGVPISPDLLTLALTHRSYAYEHGGLPTNERLEFWATRCSVWW